MKLSVVIPARNETVMLAITVRNALEELKAIGNDGEVVIVDNSDEDIWRILRTPNISPLPLGHVQSGQVRLFHQPFPSLYSARQTAIEQANSEYAINTDSHTMYGRDMLKDVIEFMDSDKANNVGMGFSPVGWVSAPEWIARGDIRPNAHGSIFGPWGRTYDKPTKIPWHFGFRVVRKDWFLNECGGYGFFAKKRISWGGGEFYVAMKTWMLGKECWTIPSAPVYHIGPFSKEVYSTYGMRYRTYGSSGVGRQGIGILAAFYALGGDNAIDEAMKLKDGITQYGLDVERDWLEARKLAEEDRAWIQKNQKISFFDLLKEKPWMEGWDEKRWSGWKPNAPKFIFNLNKLKEQDG